MTQELGPLARELSMPYYADALPAHDSFHAKRVRDTAIRLANESEEHVDRGVLSAAAWLHDIGRPRERVGDIPDHDKWGANEAEVILTAEGVDTDDIEAIKHCIRAHSIRSSSPEPATLEAKYVFDADKLEAIGARGLIRLACIVGERSGQAGEKYAIIEDSSASEIVTEDRPDITLLKEWATERLESLYTSPGKELGRSRWAFMQDFFARFNTERD